MGNYTRETIDALLHGLRQEFRADLKEEVGALRTEMARMEGRLHAEISGLRGEWKIWLMVWGSVLAVLSSGVGNRILNLLWPGAPVSAPPGSSTPRVP